MSGIDEKTRIALSRPDLLREAAFIGGSWRKGTATIPVENPATGGIIGHVPSFGRAEAEEAVALATRALPAWRARSAAERATILRRWNDLVLANAEDLARLMSAEQGKPLAEARAEVAYGASFLAWFAEEARRIYGDIIPGHLADRRLSVRREPVGVVSAITPWNFPLAMITRKAGPALAAGCTMVLKPSELTPFSALALAVLAEQAGVPPGVFSVVTGEPHAIGDVLVEDPRIAKFTFTGSTVVGKALAARCMGTVKRVSLELGGNAPLIVFDDADLDTAIEGTIASKFRNAGQTCVCANRIYVQQAIKPAFLEKLSARVGAMRTGDAFAGDAPIGPLIDDRARAKAQQHVDDALARGGRLLVGGQAIDGLGLFYAPTLIDEVAHDALLCREETFAPVAGIIGFVAEDDVIAMANDTRAGLAAYVFTRDFSRVHRVTEALEYGMVGVNTGLITSEVVPFGGVKESGFGREGSRYGIDDYTHTKLICAAV